MFALTDSCTVAKPNLALEPKVVRNLTSGKEATAWYFPHIVFEGRKPQGNYTVNARVAWVLHKLKYKMTKALRLSLDFQPLHYSSLL